MKKYLKNLGRAVMGKAVAELAESAIKGENLTQDFSSRMADEAIKEAQFQAMKLFMEKAGAGAGFVSANRYNNVITISIDDDTRQYVITEDKFKPSQLR